LNVRFVDDVGDRVLHGSDEVAWKIDDSDDSGESADHVIEIEASLFGI
jgi:hypothetical protein